MIYFFSSLLLSIIFSFLVRRLALRFNIVQAPDNERRFHKNAVPLLGGVAIFLAFWLVAGWLLYVHPIRGIEILTPRLTGVFLASLVVLALGIFDDIRPIPAWARLGGIMLAALLAAVGGLGLEKITNPLGGVFQLGQWKILMWGDYVLTIGSVVVFLWLSGMMFTSKILDGLDGLATGIIAIGALVIYLLSSTTPYFQPNVALLSLVFLGSLLGFLGFNFYPAKLFLGEGGSIFIGLILGTLAVVGGGKLATALLVMAIPILDLARVVYERIKNKQSIFRGDRRHLHFRLVDGGLGVRSAVGIYYALALIFGLSTLFLQSIQKVYALLFLVVVGGVIIWQVNKRKKI